ncbi:hypothetical protein NC652_004744 [Populus alba x Populus x berolinensis]|nr:hypothetical protein NC652_004744 [Populus alba x Populus x berolinensis]
MALLISLPFSSSNPSPSPPQTSSLSGQSQPSALPPSTVAGSGESGPRAPSNDNPRTTSSGFDPEALERGAKALKEIASSSHAKKVFESIKTQEATRQAELAAKAAEYKAMQAQAETERQRVVYDETEEAGSAPGANYIPDGSL